MTSNQNFFPVPKKPIRQAIEDMMSKMKTELIQDNSTNPFLTRTVSDGPTDAQIEQVIHDATRTVNESNLSSQIESIHSQLNPPHTIDANLIRDQYQTTLNHLLTKIQPQNPALPIPKNAHINESQKLYFARLRVRLNVHKKVFTYLRAVKKKNAINEVIGF
jgi:hypothetical protein